MALVALVALVAQVAAGCRDRGAAARPSPPPKPVAELVDAGPRGVAARFYDAYVAETVAGDRSAARAGYEEVLAGAAGGERALAARAALRLARLRGEDGDARGAAELLARAASLGGDDPELLAAVDAQRLALAGSGAPAAAALRGPAAGSLVEGAGAEAAARFARAEELLGAYQARGVRARIERFDEDVARKQGALDAAVRAYRAVLETGDGAAAAAALFRIGSLHHEHALALLTLEIPPELEPAYAAPVRRDLRRRALKNLEAAQDAYAASLAAGGGAPGVELWHAAAREGARAAAGLAN